MTDRVKIRSIILPFVYLAVFTLVIIIYGSFDPGSISLFPECPFRKLTGFLCPGCGSQRAVHDLLNLDITSAFSHNSLLVISIPYVVSGFILDVANKPGSGLLVIRKIFYGRTAALIVLIITCSFWVVRNIIACNI